ncbi:MAG: hypothetical protein J6D12_01360 [Peptostreptococcaceae bacterium]|nr:hypothetical protein [Peptostreptococcaceae bacterium]
MNKYYIYEWYNIETGEVFYIGKGCNNRYKDINRNKFFNDYYKTHKCDSRIVVDDLYEKEAFKLEKELIKHYRENTNYRLTNQTDGGEGVSCPGDKNPMHKSNYTFTEEHRKKISEKAKGNKRALGLKRSQEVRDKISKSLSGDKHPNYGKPRSEETKKKISDNSFWKTEEGKKQLSKRLRENPLNKVGVKVVFPDGTIKNYKMKKDLDKDGIRQIVDKVLKTGEPYYTDLPQKKKYFKYNGLMAYKL